jgi:YD repeat-containing protein
VGWSIDIKDAAGTVVRTLGGGGKIVSATWSGRDAGGSVAQDGNYTALLTAWTDVPDCKKTASTQVTVKSCKLDITDFNGNDAILRPSAGGDVKFTASVDNPCNKPFRWKLTIDGGKTYEGSGLPIEPVWDGKNNNDAVVDPGSYKATLTVQSDDGEAFDSDSKQFKVEEPPPGQCGLYVDFGSSAHVASGNLSHSQELFSTKSSALPLAMTLHYNSLDPHYGSLGRGWSHSYDISLKENSDGSVLVSEGNWKRKLYELVNGAYVSKPGDYATLVKNAAGSFILTHKDGLRYNFDADGKIASIVDRNGNAVTFGFTGGNLTTVTDPAGRTATLAYDTANQLTSIVDPMGTTHSLSYGSNTLGSVSTQNSKLETQNWIYTYDDKAYMLTKTDPLGNVTSYGYDDKHRVVSSSDPEGMTRSISYPRTTDTVKSTTFTEKDGGVWTYSYDTQNGYLLGKTDPRRLSGTLFICLLTPVLELFCPHAKNSPLRRPRPSSACHRPWRGAMQHLRRR